MRKEEILAKSRAENQKQDEMERQTMLESESFSLMVTGIIGSLLMICKIYTGDNYHDIMAMFWGTSVGCAVYRLVRRRQKTQVWFVLISLAFLLRHLIKYLMGA